MSSSTDWIVTEERGSQRAWVAGLVILSALLTAAYRFLAIRGFDNDHFVHLTAAHQMLFGEWPTRDFIDIGRPLTIVASAAAQWLIGRTLLSEALLVSAGFGIAAALTAAVVARLTGSFRVALGAVILEAVAFPRTYAYPKILATALGLWLIGHFLRRPTRARQALMAVGVTVAFLFRHDLGLIVGLGALVASLLRSPDAPWRERAGHGLVFAVMVAALIAPYLVYVQVAGSVWNYFDTALTVNAEQTGMGWPNPFAPDAPKGALLLYAFHLIPVGAIVLCWVERRRGLDRWTGQFVIAAAVLAVAANIILMRHPVWVRVPDAIVPAVVLGAWLARRAWLARSQYARISLALVGLGAVFLVGDLGSVSDNLDRTGLSEPWRLADLVAERSAMLRGRFTSDPPSRNVLPLRPFFDYLDRCTTSQHRLFIAGFLPEVPYYAGRPFAGGAHEYFTYWLPRNQQWIVAHLRQQVAPFALMPSDVADVLDADLPAVASYLRGRYRLLTDVPVYEARSIRILVDDTLPPTSRDAETGWPCFL